MANTYSWDCRTVDTYPTLGDNADVVHTVHWRLKGVDSNGVEDSTIGTCELATDSIESFVAFSDLTNDSVTAWVEAALGADKVAELKASVDAMITEKANPTSVTKYIS
tara:strand:- start:21 stop:344 length:324 start_codon:yes stop_codon:yes gene_type:complete